MPDSFDVKQASTLGPRLVRSLSHLPQAYEVGLSVPRVPLVKNTGVETLLTALCHSGLVRKVPTDIAAKLLGPSMKRKIGSEGFAADGIRFNKCYREMGQALKRLDKTLDTGKLFHPVIRGILLLENSGLNGSEVSTVLATQENSYDSRHGGGWCAETPVNLEERFEWEPSEEEQIDESGWSVWPVYDTRSTGWDESYWDDIWHWNYEPEYTALESLSAM